MMQYRRETCHPCPAPASMDRCPLGGLYVECVYYLDSTLSWAHLGTNIKLLIYLNNEAIGPSFFFFHLDSHMTMFAFLLAF